MVTKSRVGERGGARSGEWRRWEEWGGEECGERKGETQEQVGWGKG